MLKLVLISSLLLVLAALAFAAGCGSKSTATTPSSTPTTALTFGQMADSGKTVFAGHCASCHGAQGQGGRAPAVIGGDAHLAKYNTAQGLLDFVDATMPANTPGSLSHQDYLDVVSYLCVQDNDVSADTAFDEGHLDNIPLK
jgi:mono/diheme cytochrome c family protein